MSELPDLDECVRNALTELGESSTHRRNGTQSYDIYLNLLEKKLNDDDHPLTKGEFEDKIHRILVQSIGEDDPIEAFNEQKGEFFREIDKMEPSTWSVIFPLPLFAPPGISFPQSVEYRDLRIQNIEISNLRRYESKLEDSATDNSRYQSFKNKKLSKDWGSGEWSFWRYTIDALSPERAIRNAERDLELILAKMNFALTSDRYPHVPDSGHDVVGGLDSEGVISPVCFLLLDDHDNVEFRPGQNLSPRSHRPVPRHWHRKLQNYPDFQESHPLDECILPALRAFQQGQSAGNYDKRFLDYWRGIESASIFSTDDDSQSGVKSIRRAITFVTQIDIDILRFRADELRDKRNNLVHKADGPDVYMQDINFLKMMLVTEISGLLKLREHDEFGHSIERTRKIMERGREDSDILQEDIQDIRTVLDWKDQFLQTD